MKNHRNSKYELLHTIYAIDAMLVAVLLGSAGLIGERAVVSFVELTAIWMIGMHLANVTGLHPLRKINRTARRWLLRRLMNAERGESQAMVYRVIAERYGLRIDSGWKASAQHLNHLHVAHSDHSPKGSNVHGPIHSLEDFEARYGPREPDDMELFTEPDGSSISMTFRGTMPSRGPKQVRITGPNGKSVIGTIRPEPPVNDHGPLRLIDFKTQADRPNP